MFLAEVVQQLYSSCTEVVQKLYSSFTAVVQKLYSSCTAVVQKLYSSCTAVVQQLYSNPKHTQFVFNKFFENRACCEVMWRNMVVTCRSQMSIQYGTCALHAGYLMLQTDTHNMKHVLLFPRQQWLRERASILRYMKTYIACLFNPHPFIKLNNPELCANTLSLCVCARACVR